MRKKYLISIALLLALFAFGRAYPWGSTGGDATEEAQITETAIFFNNSGATIQDGSVVVFDLSGTGVSAGTTLGVYVTTTTTADSTAVVGVMQYDCSDQRACPVVTKGPIDTLVLGISDGVAVGDWVGTSTTAGYAGSFGNGNTVVGTGILGKALEADDGTDTGKVIVFVNPK